MKYNAKAPTYHENNLIVSKVLDGDSLIVKNIFNKQEKEIRLYGIDAPENKKNKKLIRDEKVTHLAGEFLIMLGMLSTKYVLTIIPPGTKISITTELNNYYDFYNRQLAYVFLSDGTCLNEILVRDGYAKTMEEYYCTMLPQLQILGFDAQKNRKGLYAFSDNF